MATTRPKDPTHWLYRLAPREWLRAAMGELSRTETAIRTGDRRGGLAGCRRAAGMAVNGWLAAADEPAASYGRSYMDHLAALAQDATVIEPVSTAARLLVAAPMPGGAVVMLRTRSTDENLLEAARTIMADALARVLHTEDAPPDDGSAPGGTEP